MKKSLIIFVFSILCSGLPAQETPVGSGLYKGKPEKAGSGYSFTEGCSVAKDGKVYFTDQPNDRIYVWDEKSGIHIFKEGAERSNGTYFDKEGNLLACADLHNRIVKFTPSGKMIPVLSEGYEGKPFNGPNDLWPDNKGGIYFTDPYYPRDYWEKGHKQMQDVEGVYYLAPDGSLKMLIGGKGQPNGIVGSPDGKWLYVADIRQKTIWKYEILSDGSLKDPVAFAPVGSDGMTIDREGNIYVTWGKVIIFNKSGEKTDEIDLPETPSNVCFGGKDRKTLFITARTSVYTLHMNVRGVE
jgi:gluconolactonase